MLSGYCRSVDAEQGDRGDEFSELPIERDRSWRHPSEIARNTRLNRNLRIVRFLGWLAILVAIGIKSKEIFPLLVATGCGCG